MAGLIRRHPWPVALAAVGVVLAILLASTITARIAGGPDEPSIAQWHPAASPDPADVAAPGTSPPIEVISLSATGDIILGDAGSLPPRDGEGFFDAVTDALAAISGPCGRPRCDSPVRASPHRLIA